MSRYLYGLLWSTRLEKNIVNVSTVFLKHFIIYTKEVCVNAIPAKNTIVSVGYQKNIFFLEHNDLLTIKMMNI